MDTSSPTQTLQGISAIPKGRIGRFIAEREIGRGSVGTVYECRDPLIGRKVAIKILNSQLPSDQRQLFEDHFIQEARAAGRLNHPNIVTVYDADKSEDLLFIAMEYLEGKELRDMISGGHRFGYKQIADMIARVANALDYAHQNGVVHRDIKPANIFIVGKYTPKVLDFGIASASRQLADAEASLGFANATERRLLGTPSYMSPEQTRAEILDARTDIFSLGIVLYQLLCGELPFKGTTLQEVLESIEYDSPVPPTEIRSDVPPRLAYIAGKAMSKKAADRYATAADMASDLNRYLAKERTNQIIATLRNPESAKKLDPEDESAKKEPQPAREKMQHRLPIFAGAAIAIISIVTFGVIALVSDPVAPGPMLPPAAKAADINVAGKTAQKPGVTSLSAASEVDASPGATGSAAHPIEETMAKRDAAKVSVAELKSENRNRQKPAKAVVRAASPAAVGSISIAVTPWGEVFVDGKSKGVAPPLTHLSLSIGPHSVEIRNGDDRYAVKIQVTPNTETRIGHRF